MPINIITVRGPKGAATIRVANKALSGHMAVQWPMREWLVHMDGNTVSRHDRRNDAIRAAFEVTDAPRWNVPNLDCEPDLHAWLLRTKLRDVILCPRDDEAAVLRHLRDYAKFTLYARQDRISGNIPRAMLYEARAERVFNLLPDEARW